MSSRAPSDPGMYSRAASHEELAHRRDLLDFGEDDHRRLKGLDQLTQESLAPALEHLRRRFLGSDDTRVFVERPQLLAQLTSAHEALFSNLDAGASRVRAIELDERLGLPFHRWLAAYHIQLRHLTEQLAQKHDSDPAGVFLDMLSLVKLAFLDIGVAVDIYERGQKNLMDRATRLLNDLLETGFEQAIILLDSDRCIVSWNEAARAMYGYAARELIGRTDSLLSPDATADEGPTLPELIERALRAGRARGTIRQLRKDGETFRAETSVLLRRGEDREPLGWLVQVKQAQALPERPAAPRLPTSHGEESHEPPHGTETILLVEDDAAVRALVRDILETLGYRILEAADGSAALELCDESNKIDLVVTDLYMPGMDGRELGTQIAARHPNLKLVFLTGYPQAVAADSGLVESEREVIQKPFTIESLARKIRQLLDSSPR